MKKDNRNFDVFYDVFTNWKYLALTLFVSFIFYFLNGAIANAQNYMSFYKSLGFLGATSILAILSLKFLDSVSYLTAGGIVVLSLLFGVLFSLLAYRFGIMKSAIDGKIGLTGGAGLFFGLAAPGCAACGVGLVSLLGFSSALASLPFKGKEIVFIAIGLLAISISNVSSSIGRSCNLNNDISKRKMKGGNL